MHTTPDCYGGMRLGPFETWRPDSRDPVKDFNSMRNRSYIGSSSIDLIPPPDLKKLFVDSVRPFLPFIDEDGIAPDSSSIHSKIQKEGEAIKDWVIRHEADR